MNVNEFAIGALENAYGLATQSVDGLTDEEMMFQPKEGMNPPLWLLAHIVGSENGLILSFCKGENLLPKGWQKKFGIGATPSTNAEDYPTKDEMLALWEKVHAAAIGYVKSLAPEDFDKQPPGIEGLPERMQQLFATVARCLFVHITHTASHAGQIGTIRRLLGKAPRV